MRLIKPTYHFTTENCVIKLDTLKLCVKPEHWSNATFLTFNNFKDLTLQPANWYWKSENNIRATSQCYFADFQLDFASWEGKVYYFKKYPMSNSFKWFVYICHFLLSNWFLFLVISTFFFYQSRNESEIGVAIT